MARRASFLDIPAVERKWGVLGLLLNIVPWGGVGSITVGVHAKHKPTIVIGVLQAVLTFAVIGYLWSIAWGLGIFLRSVPTAKGR